MKVSATRSRLAWARTSGSACSTWTFSRSAPASPAPRRGSAPFAAARVRRARARGLGGELGGARQQRRVGRVAPPSLGLEAPGLQRGGHVLVGAADRARPVPHPRVGLEPCGSVTSARRACAPPALGGRGPPVDGRAHERVAERDGGRRRRPAPRAAPRPARRRRARYAPRPRAPWPGARRGRRPRSAAAAASGRGATHPLEVEPLEPLADRQRVGQADGADELARARGRAASSRTARGHPCVPAAMRRPTSGSTTVPDAVESSSVVASGDSPASSTVAIPSKACVAAPSGRARRARPATRPAGAGRRRPGCPATPGRASARRRSRAAWVGRARSRPAA